MPSRPPLATWFPRAGFRWRRGPNQPGSSRILRSKQRDNIVRDVILHIVGHGGRTISKSRALELIVHAVAAAAKAVAGYYRDDKAGARAGGLDDLVEVLERERGEAELSRAIPGDVWVELVYQIAHARREYKRQTTTSVQQGAEQYGLAKAIDNRANAAGSHWDWIALEFAAYPHFIGEPVDYVVDDE
ncbi:hypothetical protein C8A05DRAFT_37114 [Staphylotrichum tortipilum]|uniref:Uncharacterized protein n=1 Tax=Staphylotrichum tortipilum TaxID=2831512 RepID=A0AAN6MFJ3_9PEZI|nr:hypothetical protein C8A05DRAFT_37114 [Staphylotrichum longicolle]